MFNHSKIRRATFILALGCLLVSGGKAFADEKDGKKAEPLLSKNDELKADDEKDTNLTNSPRKVYKVKLAAGKTYQIELHSKDFDSVLRLEDATGKEVAFNDDAPGEMTLDARIVYKAPKAGEYSIIATCLDAKPGKFMLTLAEIPGVTTASKFTGKAGELVLKGGKARHEGELAKADPAVSNRYYKVFTIKLEAGKTYRIDHRGADPSFDAFLFLEDADGNTQAEDDDSGGGLNAQINYKADKTGTYRIIATTLPPGQTGKFTLEVATTEAKDGKQSRLAPIEYHGGRSIALRSPSEDKPCTVSPPLCCSFLPHAVVPSLIAKN